MTNVPKNEEAAQAVTAAQDGTKDTIHTQDTTIPAWGQHVCDEDECICGRCRRDMYSCCFSHVGVTHPKRGCPVEYCPDYLPEDDAT